MTPEEGTTPTGEKVPILTGERELLGVTEVPLMLVPVTGKFLAPTVGAGRPPTYH